MDRFHALFKSEKTASKEAKVKKVLSDLWKDRSEREKYRSELLSILGTPTRADEAERVFCEDFVKYDILYNIPRLKDDPHWKSVEKSLEKMRKTGRCFFCEAPLDYNEFLRRSLCTNRDCAHMFFMKPDFLIAAQAQEISVSVAMERRWAQGLSEG